MRESSTRQFSGGRSVVLLWDKVILPHVDGGPLVLKLPAGVRDLLLDHLAAAG